jgi:DNA-binding FrmR family transcriptional regulator
MLPEEKTAIMTRIHSIEINVRAIISMVETGKDCEEVLLQLQASQAALHAAGRLLLIYQLKWSHY